MYFNFLEQNLNTHTYSVILFVDFSVPYYGSSNGASLPIPSYGNKINENLMTVCSLSLNQHNDSLANNPYQS
jgi:hypothetical protein